MVFTVAASNVPLPVSCSAMRASMSAIFGAVFRTRRRLSPPAAKNKTREGATWRGRLARQRRGKGSSHSLGTNRDSPKTSRGPGSGAGGPSLPATTAEPKLHAQQHTVFFMFIS